MLKGETLASKLAYFRNNGTLGDYPRVNQVAFEDWMDGVLPPLGVVKVMG